MSLYSTSCLSDKLRANLLLKLFHLEVDLRHVALYNEDLAHSVQDKPGDVLPLVRYFIITDILWLTRFLQFELAATKAARSILYPLAGASQEKQEAAERAIINIQVTVKSGLNLLQFRGLTVC